MSNRAINLTGGVITLEGEAGVMYVAKDTGNVSFGDNPWYQWSTSPTGKLSLSSENPYVYGDKQNTYLHIEPAGTTYELVVEGGSGNGSYAPGTEVAISAGTPTADGHFAAWNVTTGNDGILADASAAETTFTVPVGGANVSATLESHTLTHHEGQDPTCTEPGWAAYDTCAECGYSSYTVLPATGHSFENGVCTVCGATDQDFEPDSQNPESDQDESTENETSSKMTTDEAAKESIPLTGENAFPVALLAAVAGAGTIAVATLVRRRKK